MATTCVSISGKYSVVVFDNSGIGVSKKITNNDRREALRKIAEPYNVDGYNNLATNCEISILRVTEEEYPADF